jgi:hypothetical protein
MGSAKDIVPILNNEDREASNNANVEFTGPDKIWTEQGEIYRLRDKTKQLPKLDKAVYTLDADIFGFYLERLEDSFKFDHKLYGLEVSLIDRVLKTYKATKGNLGILLNGVKGTGKTVTAKIICNKLDMPVVIVPKAIGNCNFFLNGIPQDIIIFIDEYEKVFSKDKENSADMLTIMDGAMNSEHRRTFILTTNQLHINENLIQRPGRIRYLKTFSDLQPEVIEEIVDDRLKHKEFRDDVVKFISNLEIITVDIVNSIIDEVNIHKESTATFKDVFNVRKISGKYNILLVNEKDGSTTELKKGVQIYPRKLDDKEDELLNYYFEAGGERMGRIVEVIGRNVLRIQPEVDMEKVAAKLRKRKTAGESKASIVKKLKAEIPPPFIIRVEDADVTNWKYKYGNAASNNEYSHLF